MGTVGCSWLRKRYVAVFAAVVGWGCLGCGGEGPEPLSLSTLEGRGTVAWHGDYAGCTELGSLGGGIAAISWLGVAVRLEPPTDALSAQCLRVAVLRPNWLGRQVGRCVAKIGELLPAWNLLADHAKGNHATANCSGDLLAEGPLCHGESLQFTYDMRGYQVTFQEIRTRPESFDPGAAWLDVTPTQSPAHDTTLDAQGAAGDEAADAADAIDGAVGETGARLRFLVTLDPLRAPAEQYGYWPGTP